MKRLLALAACLGLMVCACSAPIEESPAYETVVNGVQVSTDWSKLTEREELSAVGTRWYEGYTDRLLPRPDYGALIPYAGLRLMDDWPADTGCLYGLMTRDGTVVTDPVYSAVYRPSWWDAGRPQTHPLLILKQGDPASEDAWSPEQCAVAAADGSWSTGFLYRCVTASEEGLLLFSENSMTVMAPDGTIERVWTGTDMGLTQEEFDGMLSALSWGEGAAGERLGDYVSLPSRDGYVHYRCLDLRTGQVEEILAEEWYDRKEYQWQEDEPYVSPVEGATPVYDSLLGSGGTVLLWGYEEGRDVYYQEDGTPLPDHLQPGEQWVWYRRTGIVGGLIEVLDYNTASYYDAQTLDCVFRTFLGFE